MPAFLQKLFDTSDFPPRWRCGTWTEAHGWTHIVADVAIWAAYTTIPIALLVLARRHRGLLRSRLFLLFALFILSCGATHLLEAVIFWHPVYRLAASMKVATAVLSWACAVALIRHAPQALSITRLGQLNADLRTEMARRAVVEEQLARSEARFRLTFEEAPVGLAHVGADGRWRRVNAALCDFLGYTPEELRARTVSDVTYPEDVVPGAEVLARLAAGDLQRASVEKRYVHRDGRPLWAEVTVNYIQDDPVDGPHTISVVQDLRQRKEYEEELEQAREAAEAANRARGEFLANTSHEIRTPLAAILGHTDILLRRIDDPDLRKEVRTIRRSGEHLLGVINDVLDLSRIEAGRLEVELGPCNLAVALRDVHELLSSRADAGSVDFRLVVTGPLPTNLRTDGRRIKQVLLNLVGNALKFTPEGVVELRAAHDAEAREVRLEVCDTGIGIPEDVQRAIFEPFRQGDASLTRRHGGTGLGLPISVRLAESLGGRIEVESRAGEGSLFTFVLPADQPDLELAPYVDQAPDDPLPGGPADVVDGRVLVVDDRPEVRRVVQHFLEEAGAEVLVASDGVQAVEAVERAAADGAPIDLVVMDVQMPNMDGHEATRELRRRGHTVPIVALTASAMREDELRALDAGCDAYLAKPVEVDSLVALVARLVRGG